MKHLPIFIILMLCLASCKTKYITVETVHDVYHNTVDTIRDSIKHEIFVKEFVKGDTVYQYHTEYLYKDRWKVHDSIIIQRDSVPYPVEVIKEVKKPTPIWHYLVVGGAILVLLFNLYKKFLS